MAYDYSDDLAFAQTVISEFGELYTFEKPGLTINPLDPLGPSLDAPVTFQLAGVGVEVIGTSFGRYVDITDLVKNHSRVILTPGYAAEDIETFALVTDAAGVAWTIGEVMSFAPGNTKLLHFVGLNK